VDDVREKIGLHAQLACIWEATARKPGNVHRFADFADLSYLDFVTAAAAVAPVLAASPDHRVGRTVLEGVRRTRLVARSNVNLGILLVLAPLTKAAVEPDLREGLRRVLDDLDVEDARLVYEAIRLANPGGLGTVSEEDVRKAPTRTLREAMTLAADRDLIARQYANGFRDVFDDGAPAVLEGLERSGSLEGAIVFSHLRLMARHPDSLIARKCGPAVAAEASRRAQAVFDSGWPHGAASRTEFADFDDWLRADGHARNPGATADLVVACLFVVLHEDRMDLALKSTWAAELDAEAAFDRAIAQSSDKLASLAAEALAEHRAGETAELDPEQL
jgi:triphosphoribosyl-dephospho-CoA synthase